MRLNNLVDRIYCINLDRRPDRWDRCRKVFSEHDLDVKRFPAVDGKTLSGGKLPLGALGVLRSNLGVIEGARRDNLASICIFEDDIELDRYFVEKFSSFIKHVPNDWAFIYLGGSNKKPTTSIGGIDCPVRKMHKTYGAYAIIIRSTIFDTIIDRLSKEDKHLDFVYAEMHSEFPSYIMHPFLAWVRNDYSDINERFIDVSYLKQDNAK